MGIASLNAKIQKHSRWLLGIVTVIIIVAFVLFPGIGGSFLDVNGTGAQAASVFGKKITMDDLNKSIQDLTVIYALQNGVRPDRGLFNVSCENGLQFAIMNAAAEKLGVTVSQAKVGEFIRTVPAFLTAGKFDLAKYEKYEKEQLIPNGMNALSVDKAVHRFLMANALASAAGDVPEVSDPEVMEFAANYLQKYQAFRIRLPLDGFRKAVKCSEKDLKAFFGKHGSEFSIPAKCRAEAVVFRYSDYAKDFVPSSAQIAKVYQEKKPAKNGKKLTLAQAAPEIRKELKRAEQERLALAAATAFREKLYAATANAAGDRNQYVEAFRAAAGQEKTGKLQKIGFFSTPSDAKGPLKEETSLLQALLDASERTSLTAPVKGNSGVFVGAVTVYEKARKAAYGEVSDAVRAAYVNGKAVEAARGLFAEASAKAAAGKLKASGLDKAVKGASVTKLAPFSVMEPGKTEQHLVMLAAGTPAGTLAKPMEIGENLESVFVESVTQPGKTELEKNKAQFTLFCRIGKQQARQESFNLWLSRNIRNMMVRE